MLTWKTVNCTHCYLPIRLRISIQKGQTRFKIRKPYCTQYKYDTGWLNKNDSAYLQCPNCHTRLSNLWQYTRGLKSC